MKRTHLILLALVATFTLIVGCSALSPKKSPAKDALTQLKELDATALTAEKAWADGWKLRMHDAITRGDVADQTALRVEQQAADRTVRSYQEQHLANEALLSATLSSTNGQPYEIPASLINAHFSLTNTLYAYPHH